MPIYMDIHLVPGVEAIHAAEAHSKDILIQDAYGCNCMTYWIDPSRGVVFCLIEGPDKSNVEEMHKHSHGLVPNKLIEVQNELVEGFLGRIHDPKDALVTESGLKVFQESALRILMAIQGPDRVVLSHLLGAEKGRALIDQQHNVARAEIVSNGGRLVQQTGGGFIASFVSAIQAVGCAIGIHKNLQNMTSEEDGLMIGIHAGEPVAKSDKLFGDTVRLARRLSQLGGSKKIAISNAVKELLGEDEYQIIHRNVRILTPPDEGFVDSVYTALETHWQDADFDMNSFCKKLAMSKSRLYRKIISIWGLSPITLLKEFRLDKARTLLQKQSSTIAETTFDAGFNSPSYFTKCFKKKYGLLPAMYLESLE